MNFENLQAERESCRVYSDKKVSCELLTHLVDVARMAPSGCNSQPSILLSWMNRRHIQK
ncbi:nitroreductase family protein [Faecalicatena faecalis]|uniref:nitroreductase family protein n=1 Tax=Faecalicatena faecalis TaxID=2726362 RepID=UPI001FE74ED0|nr:nitroreductase family protein [Faecalicatena faecalis]